MRRIDTPKWRLRRGSNVIIEYKSYATSSSPPHTYSKKTATLAEPAWTPKQLSRSLSLTFLYYNFSHLSSQLLPDRFLLFFSCQTVSATTPFKHSVLLTISSYVMGHLTQSLPSSYSVLGCRNTLRFTSAAAVQHQHQKTSAYLFNFHLNLIPSFCNIFERLHKR